MDALGTILRADDGTRTSNAMERWEVTGGKVRGKTRMGDVENQSKERSNGRTEGQKKEKEKEEKKRQRRHYIFGKSTKSYLGGDDGWHVKVRAPPPSIHPSAPCMMHDSVILIYSNLPKQIPALQKYTSNNPSHQMPINCRRMQHANDY